MERNEARRRGDELSQRLGEGWATRTWENLGWHFSSIHESTKLQVHEFAEDRFWATTDIFDPDHRPQFCADGRTPQEAVDAVLTKMEKVVKLHTAMLASLKKGLGRIPVADKGDRWPLAAQEAT